MIESWLRLVYTKPVSVGIRCEWCLSQQQQQQQQQKQQQQQIIGQDHQSVNWNI